MWIARQCSAVFPLRLRSVVCICAKLDALFFHLYGIIKWDDVRYIYSTFPIAERQDRDAYGCYRSLEFCLAYMNALAAGRPDVVVEG